MSTTTLEGPDRPLESEGGLPPSSPLPRSLQSIAGVIAEGPVDRWAHRRWGDVFVINAFPFERLVAVCDPVEVKRLWTLPPDQLDAGQGNAVLGPLVGRSSTLLLDADQHLQTRRALLPPFHGERMRALGEVMREEAAVEIASWPIGTRFCRAPSSSPCASSFVRSSG